MKKTLLVLFSLLGLQIASAQTNTSSLLFDGTASYVEVPNSASLNPSNALTIEAWIKPDSFGTNVYSNYIVGKEDWATSSAGYCLRCGATGSLSFNFSDGFGGWKEVISSDSTLSLGTWTHVAGVFDGTKLSIYINGVLSGSLMYTGTIHTSTYPLRIGGVPYTTSGLRLFNGRIDQVDIWNKALSANEVVQYMECSPGGNELGLVGLWKFEEGTGTSTADGSPFSNHGTLMSGMSWSTDVPALNCSVGIDENSSSLFAIAPNPSNGKIKLTFNNAIENGRMQIYSALGEKCFDEFLTNTSSKEIGLEKFSKGIYYLKVSQNGKATTQKLVIE